MASGTAVSKFNDAGPNDMPETRRSPSLEETGPGDGGRNAWVKHKDERHRHYAEQWEYVEDHYTGEATNPGKVRRYIPQKELTEPKEDYEERVGAVTCPGLLPFLVDSFSGMLQAGDRNTSIVYAEEGADGGLGDVETPGTEAYKLANNADGDGLNFETFWTRFDNRLIRYFEVWVLVNGAIKDADGHTIQDPHFQLIDPIAVTNTFYRDGRLTDVVVEHFVDGRTSIMDGPGKIRRWTHYHLYGADVYEERKLKNGKTEIVRKLDLAIEYAYFETTDRRKRILPIFPSRLTLDRFVTYQAARTQNEILNLESEKRASLRNGLLARFALVGSQAFADSLRKEYAKGFKTLRHDPKNSTQHYFVAPPDAFTRIAEEEIERKSEAFMVNNFRDYANAAREKTATEIKSDNKAGKEAFLLLLAASKTEAQNRAFFLLEQSHFPDKPSLWGRARVNREPDFSLVTGKELVETVLEKVFSDRALPLGPTSLESAARMVLDYFGLEYDEDELKTAVQASVAARAQEEAATSAFGIGG